MYAIDGIGGIVDIYFQKQLSEIAMHFYCPVYMYLLTHLPVGVTLIRFPVLEVFPIALHF